MLFTQNNQRRAPGAAGFIGGPDPLLHFGQSREQVMHAGPQGAAALAVDDADAVNAAFAAFGEVFGQEAADLARTEGVQVEFRADGVLHHGRNQIVVIAFRHEWNVCLGKGSVQPKAVESGYCSPAFRRLRGLPDRLKAGLQCGRSLAGL